MYADTGKERDQESGLDYFGTRYYGGSMGRWMSPDWSDVPDPIPFADLSNPQSLNLYGYLVNNPLSDIDEDGHDSASATATCQGGLSFICKIINFFNGGGGGSGSSGGTGGSSGPQDYWPNEYGRQVAMELGRRAPAAQNLINIQAGIAAVSVAAPAAIMAGSGAGVASLGLNEFAPGEIDTVVESAARPASSQISEGARALAKKFGHARSGGFQSAFDGVEGRSPSEIIRSIMRNPSRVVRGSRTTDIYDAAGRGVRIDSITQRFIGFLEKGLATR